MVAMLAFAGCVEEEPEENPEPEQGDPETQTSTQSSTATATSQPEPPAATACDPTVVASGDRYKASCTVTKALAPKGTPDVDLLTGNGHIELTKGSTNEATVDMYAWGDTKEEAEDALAALKLTVDPDGVMVKITTGDWSNKGASIDATLTSSGFGDLLADTSNGHVEVAGFHGGSWVLDSSNGHIEVTDFTADLTADTSNGKITLNGKVGELYADTSNGRIDARLTPTKSADWTLDTSNSDVILRVPETAEIGYDITADTSNGDVTFEMSQTEPVGEQDDDERHERTTAYSTRSIQVAVAIDSSNGDIDVRSLSSQSASL